jgi:hypothetical protein
VEMSLETLNRAKKVNLFSKKMRVEIAELASETLHKAKKVTSPKPP